MVDTEIRRRRLGLWPWLLGVALFVAAVWIAAAILRGDDQGPVAEPAEAPVVVP
jgi:hypothetical protein